MLAQTCGTQKHMQLQSTLKHYYKEVDRVLTGVCAIASGILFGSINAKHIT
jgi:hypothetical protein